MILNAFFTLGWELRRKLWDCWAASEGSDLLLSNFDGLNPSTPIANHLSSLLYFSTLALLCLLQSPGCTVCGPQGLCLGHIGQWFLSLLRKWGSTQIHSEPIGIFFFSFLVENIGGEFSGHGYTTCRNKRISWLMIRLMLIPAEHSTSLSP